MIGANFTRQRLAAADPVGATGHELESRGRRRRADRGPTRRVPVDPPHAAVVGQRARVRAPRSREQPLGRCPISQPRTTLYADAALVSDVPLSKSAAVFASFCRSQAYQNTRLTPLAALST